ncbi:MAG: hypothetical protein HFJ35_03130 [Clostridia bacterium]|nr:hypothetical protein [Clostridia bacterium]
MQKLINKYFSKLCTEKFFKNDDEDIIGKVKDVIENLKEQIKFVNTPENDVCKEDIEFIIKSANELIAVINSNYTNKNDVIGISVNPMAGFYMLQSKETLFKELKEYYEELEED